MPTIFISYRREDSADVTGRIRDRLEASFGHAAVFTDVDSIPLGVDFKAYIDSRVGTCDYLLPVIGPRWLNVTDSSGGRRLDDPRDFVRAEIEAALVRDIAVIPVLVQGASMPRAEQLPQSLHPLAVRNGLSVRPDPDFRTDMDRLIKGITGNEQRLRSPDRGPWVFSRQKVLISVGSGLVALAVLWLSTRSRLDDRAPAPIPEGRPVQMSPDWRTAAAEARSVNGVEYYEVDYTQGLNANSVCSLLGKVPGAFATDANVCKAFHPDASVKIALSGDRAVVYCTGKEGDICGAYQNACISCPECKFGIEPGEWGGRLYSRLFTTCREPS